MGLMDWLRENIPSRGFPATGPQGAEVVYRAFDNPDFWRHAAGMDLSGMVNDMSPAQLYRCQPHLRTVVSFMARNIAQLGAHTYERVEDNDRRRDHDSPVARLLREPNPDTTLYELIEGTVADLALYDLCYWWLVRTSDGEWELYRLPVTWVSPHKERPFGGYDKYVVTFPGSKGGSIELKHEDLLVFHGWSPTTVNAGVSPVEALKDSLLEQLEAIRYRRAVWKRGGKVSSVITRPAGHKWSDAARKQFSENWKAKFTGNGPDTGGTPILEDGMTLNKVDFSAHEQQFIEGTRLSMNTTASVYHINPTMIGLLDNANYSNVREFRRMLYGDTLGPVIARLEGRINTFLLKRLGMDSRDFYVEFNVNEKLQGSFEEQSTVMQAATGGPWMTRNEARARQNLPAIEGGDELIIPLNVITGGQASPQDSGSQNVDPLGDHPDQAPKSHTTVTQLQVPEEFKARQLAAVNAKRGAGVDEWWDTARWDGELAKDMGVPLAVAHTLNEQTRKEVMGS